MSRDRVEDYPAALRREADRLKQRLRDAEAAIPRARADAEREVARLTAIVIEARERADAAEAKLEVLT